jgi:hypothetical protein
MSPPMSHRVALLWAGTAEERRTATLERTRLAGVAKALHAAGVAAEPAVYGDAFADEVLEQLSHVDGVLVWVNPLVNGGDRTLLDALLTQIADTGVLVSAHPQVILRIGTKEVLYATRQMGWGCDTRLYTSASELRERLPSALSEGARVLKQYRGNGGDGVWKVERLDHARVVVRHAKRGSAEEALTLDALVARFEAYFRGDGRLIDQPYQPRLVDGMVRCYLVGDRVVGFGEQLVNALFPSPTDASASAAPQPGPRLYYPPTRPDFQRLKHMLEHEWLQQLCDGTALDGASLPIIWDADFLYGPKTADGDDTYVLCEINVSSVYPFPDEALEPLANETRARLDAHKQRGA